MFEIGIFCLILLAVGYCVALWLKGRRDDVLHGHFIQADEGAAPAAATLPPTSLPKVRAERSDSLRSLLAAIKRDLEDAAQI